MNAETIQQLEEELARIRPEAERRAEELRELQQREDALTYLLAFYRGALGAKRTNIVTQPAVTNNRCAVTPQVTPQVTVRPGVKTDADFALQAIRQLYPEWSTTGLTRTTVLNVIKTSFKWSEQLALGLTEQMVKDGRLVNKGKRWYPGS